MRERRAYALAVLDRPEQLMMYANTTNDVRIPIPWGGSVGEKEKKKEKKKKERTAADVETVEKFRRASQARESASRE